ncbi:MAG: phosphotransferase family protein [Bacteroidota bacterium]
MSLDAIDQPTGVRKGEELDTELLQSYLREKLGTNGQLNIQQFPSGFSNLTYMLQFGDREYVLRKPPHGANIKGGHDMGREYRMLSMLQPVYPYVPTPVLYEEDPEILGGTFYIMERVKGVILRSKPPKGVDLNPELMKSISTAAVDHLAALHQLDLGENNLSTLGKPEGYVQRQVDGWIGRYEKAATDDILSMNEAAVWLRTHMPKTQKASLIHNDYKYDNLVLHPYQLSTIQAVLDWEMATIGDPLMDLGTTLGYWGEFGDTDTLKPFNLTWIPGNLTRAEVVSRYEEKTGLDCSEIVFYYVFGSFKIGVIVQQIYSRYRKGFTQDPRFSALIHVVRACAQNAASAIASGRISNF